MRSRMRSSMASWAWTRVMRSAIATIHPSAVLRVQDPADRDAQYADLVEGLRRAVELTEKPKKEKR